MISLRDSIKKQSINPLTRSLDLFTYVDSVGVMNYLESCAKTRPHRDSFKNEVIRNFNDTFISSFFFYEESKDEFTKRLIRSILALYCYFATDSARQFDNYKNYTNKYITSSILADLKSEIDNFVDTYDINSSWGYRFTYGLIADFYDKVRGIVDMKDYDFKPEDIESKLKMFKEGVDFLKIADLNL